MVSCARATRGLKRMGRVLSVLLLAERTRLECVRSMRARSLDRQGLSVHSSPVRHLEVIHDAGEFELQC